MQFTQVSLNKTLSANEDWKSVTTCLLVLQSNSPKTVKKDKFCGPLLYCICDPAIMPSLCRTSHFCLVSVSLQVEQLFCLGLRSRSECLKLLEMCDWNLEVASTQMLDNYGSTTRQRYHFVCSARSITSLYGIFTFFTAVSSIYSSGVSFRFLWMWNFMNILMKIA